MVTKTGVGANVGPPSIPPNPDIDVVIEDDHDEGIFDDLDQREECVGCTERNCVAAEQVIRLNHEQYENAIMAHISGEFRMHRRWLREIFLRSQLFPAMMHFSRQMTALAMHHTLAIGQFFDAENQLTTQREFQTLQIQAHDDYHPSESFCTFGTSVRSIAASDQKADLNQVALASAQLARHLGSNHTPGLQGATRDLASRWELFKTTYCDPKNNNWNEASTGQGENYLATGLEAVCGQEPPDAQRANIDIDYTRLISEPRTLDIDFTNTDETDTETDILALSQNLYGSDLLTRQLTRNALKTDEGRELYMALRAIAAKRSVAEDSFNAIAALKASGSDDMQYSQTAPNPNAPETSQYLQQILEELGMSNQRGNTSGPSIDDNRSDIEKFLGETPSYYAQLEVLAKRIYQSPDFFVKLYDKPANIKRKSAALLAIERMLDHAILESQWRQEMALSVLLSSSMEEEWLKVQSELSLDEE